MSQPIYRTFPSELIRWTRGNVFEMMYYCMRVCIYMYEMHDTFPMYMRIKCIHVWMYVCLHECLIPQEEFEGDRDERGSPSGEEGGGGMVGLGMSVLGVVVFGGFLGVGGVWAWGKFQGATRQPGVRYMATGVEDNDMGTELGPFGREYA